MFTRLHKAITHKATLQLPPQQQLGVQFIVELFPLLKIEHKNQLEVQWKWAMNQSVSQDNLMIVREIWHTRFRSMAELRRLIEPAKLQSFELLLERWGVGLSPDRVDIEQQSLARKQRQDDLLSLGFEAIAPNRAFVGTCTDSSPLTMSALLFGLIFSCYESFDRGDMSKALKNLADRHLKDKTVLSSASQSNNWRGAYHAVELARVRPFTPRNSVEDPTQLAPLLETRLNIQSSASPEPPPTHAHTAPHTPHQRPLHHRAQTSLQYFNALGSSSAEAHLKDSNLRGGAHLEHSRP